MRTLLAIIGALTVFVAVYVVVLRPFLRRRPWGQRVLDKFEPMERVLWWNSETILWSRFKMVVGGLLSTLVLLDWGTLAPLIPEKYRPYALMAPTIFLAVDGLIGEWLRRDTTKPLEVVAMRTDAPPEAKAAADVAAVANAEAVAVAKQTGAV